MGGDHRKQEILKKCAALDMLIVDFTPAGMGNTASSVLLFGRLRNRE
jgi:hypothetical protein